MLNLQNYAEMMGMGSKQMMLHLLGFFYLPATMLVDEDLKYFQLMKDYGIVP